MYLRKLSPFTLPRILSTAKLFLKKRSHGTFPSKKLTSWKTVRQQLFSRQIKILLQCKNLFWNLETVWDILPNKNWTLFTYLFTYLFIYLFSSLSVKAVAAGVHSMSDFFPVRKNIEYLANLKTNFGNMSQVSLI